MSRVRLLSAIISVAFLAVFLLPAVQPAFAQEVMPDSIMFVDGPTVLHAGGNNYVIDVQLTIRGANYSGNYYSIYIRTSDGSLIDIPQGTRLVTDNHGRASLNITTGQGYGNVTITASLLSPDGSIRTSKTYTVTASGNVSGMVFDAGGDRIHGATVTLYSMEAGEKGSVLPIAGNPVMTSGQGHFAIEDVPYGSYVVEVVIDDYNTSANLTVSRPDELLNVTVPGYIVPTPTPTPTAAPTEEPSPTATPLTGSPTPVPKTPTGDTTRQLIWIVAVAFVLAVIIIVVQWLRHRKPKK